MAKARSSRRPGYGPHRGSLNPKVTVIFNTSSTTSSQFPAEAKDCDVVIDATSSPVVIYTYYASDWHQ